MKTNFSKHPIFTEAPTIADICKPLQHLNIHHFCLVRIQANAQRTWIGTCPEFTAHYLKQKYYDVDVHSANNTLGEFFFYDNMIFRGKTLALIEDAAEFGLKQFFTLLEKNNDATNYYHFSTQSSSKNMNHIYLNHFDLLKKFTRYFNDAVNHSKELSAMENFQLPTGEAHHNCELMYDDVKINTASFEKAMQKKSHVCLSAQQKKCLHYLSLGFSAKEISLKLNISHRTVESYLDVVRNKLNFRNSKALVAWYSKMCCAHPVG